MFLLMVGTQCTQILAADIKTLSNHYCDLLLEGDIEEGDLQRLSAAVEKVERPADRDPRLCLNSEGGSYDEAIKIIRFLANGSGLNTVVHAEHTCFSACALVFMFGNHNEGDAMQSPRRELHVKGSLGFHTPHINQQDVVKKQEILARAYREGILAVGRLLESDWDDHFPKALLIDMLKTPPEAGIYADTVARASAWEISLIGYREPKELTEEMLEWSCLNVTRQKRRRWLSRWWTDSDFGANSRPKTGKAVNIRLSAGKYRRVFPGFGSEASYKCYVDVYRDPKSKFHLSVQFDADDANPPPAKGDLEKAIKEDTYIATEPLWMAYPSSTKLKQIAADQ